MTLPVDTAKSGPFNGNDVTVAFTVTFRFLRNSDLRVILADAAGVETDQVEVTDYTVAGAGDPGGGTVTFLTPPATGETVTIVRDMPFTQEIDYVPNDPFPAETHESGIDERTMETQQLRELIGRSPTFSLSSGLSDLEFPDPSALLVIGWNATEDGLTNLTIAALGTEVLPAVALNYLRRNAANTAFEARTVLEAWDDLKISATDSVVGVVELATTAEVAAGTDTTRAVTPATLSAGSGGLASSFNALSGLVTQNAELLGTEIIASFLNDDYDTFTSAGAQISSAIWGSGTQDAHSNTFTIVNEETYKLVLDITINAGVGPSISLVNSGGATVSNTVVATGGVETFFLTATGSGDRLQFTNTGAANWDSNATDISLKKTLIYQIENVKINEGAARNIANDFTIAIGSAGITKNLRLTWADGSGNEVGGRAAGVAYASDTFYHDIILGKADGTSNAGFDTDPTGAGLLADAAVISAGYIHARRVGATKTKGALDVGGASTDIKPYTQVNDYWTWVNKAKDVSTGSHAATLRTLTVPPGVPCIAHISYGSVPGGVVTMEVSVWETTQTDPGAAGVDNKLSTTSGGGADTFTSTAEDILTDVNAQVFSRSDANGFRINTWSYRDFRGRT